LRNAKRVNTNSRGTPEPLQILNGTIIGKLKGRSKQFGWFAGLRNHDFLANGYLAVGDKESARKAVMRAIELAPGDPLLDAGSKSSLLSEEHARLQKLQ
jgi:hypothetical protein